MNIKSLEVRRLYFDFILTYKIIFHLNDLDADAFFRFNRSYSTRGHIKFATKQMNNFYSKARNMYRPKLFPVYSRVDVYNNFFSNRVVQPWNSLPHHFSLFSTFKTFLKSADLSQYVQQ